MAFRRATRLDAGQRDHLVTIEAVTDGVDSEGAPTETWTTLVANMPAARYGVQGWERFNADQISARHDARWELNYRLDMDPDLVDVPKARRLVCRGRTHDIVSASIIGRKAGLELLTIAKVG